MPSSGKCLIAYDSKGFGQVSGMGNVTDFALFLFLGAFLQF